MNNFEKLLNSSTYADIKFITSDNKTIHAHKNIIFARSSKLTQALGPHAVRIGFSFETTLEFLRFIYCEKVQNIEKVAADLMILAHKYELTALVDLCCEHLAFNMTVQSASKVATIIDQNFKHVEIRNLCVNFISK